ncbi:MAG: thiamine pyrophosphate-dependent enzyme [Promethearchaeota archaeon]
MIRLRFGQMIINELYKNKNFKIPIHLALGHEAIAVAVNAIMYQDDQLILPHRNIHYNMVREQSLKAIIDEFLLKKEGLAGARLGSMNLANEKGNIVYTSSILGNNLCVAAGLALGNKVKGNDNVVFVVTGDGAIEEGAFYESLLFIRTHNLNTIIIVENNGWSLATQIHERRYNFDIEHFATAVDVRYISLKGNDPYQYIQELTKVHSHSLTDNSPFIVEVKLQTLGDWRLKTDEYPDGKYINYHAGPAPTVDLNQGPIIRNDDSDPVYVLSKHFKNDKLEKMIRKVYKRLTKETQ